MAMHSTCGNAVGFDEFQMRSSLSLIIFGLALRAKLHHGLSSVYLHTITPESGNTCTAHIS
jgi:hypothetical protein